MRLQKILEDIVESFNVLSFHIRVLHKENKALKIQIKKLTSDINDILESQKGRE